MNKLDQQYSDLARSKGNLDIGFKRSAKELEEKLKRMGIERPHRGPRISDPAHTRETIYSNSPPSVQRVVKYQSE